MKSIDKTQKEELERMKKQLSLIGSKEGNFINVEILFYEAITFSRTLSDAEDNQLLNALKQIQATEYRSAKEHYPKNTMREKAIRRFITRFKTALSDTINLYKKQGKLEIQ
jgi:ribosomal protein L29